MDRLSALQTKQQSWMRQREMSKRQEEMKSTGHMVQETDSDPVSVFNRILMNVNDKEATAAPATVSQQQESELQSSILNNTCPICYELLVPPDHAPYILFPCGHSFCEACLKSSSKVGKCPFCRTKIQSKALNIQLQNVIKTAKQQEVDRPTIEKKQAKAAAPVVQSGASLDI